MGIRIYIDLVILFNYLFDLFLLLSVNYILRRNVSKIRLFLGPLLGELSILVLFINNILIINLVKVLLSLLIVLVTFGYKDREYFEKNVIYFYIVSIVMGGGIYFLKNQFKIPYMVIIVIGLFLFYKSIKSLKYLKSNYSNYYEMKIFFDDNNYVNVRAYLDTGNKLVDPYTKKDIILLDKNRIKDVNNYIYVPYNSLNNNGLLKCIRGLKIEIDNKINTSFLIGISEDKIMMDGVDCVISTNIMEGLR